MLLFAVSVCVRVSAGRVIMKIYLAAGFLSLAQNIYERNNLTTTSVQMLNCNTYEYACAKMYVICLPLWCDILDTLFVASNRSECATQDWVRQREWECEIIAFSISADNWVIILSNYSYNLFLVIVFWRRGKKNEIKLPSEYALNFVYKYVFKVKRCTNDGAYMFIFMRLSKESL